MGKATKAVESPYYKARMECASCNDMLMSREGASELIGIDRTRLARIELGSLIPYPEEVLMMSDMYNAPELLNYHCTHDCPIGRQTLVKVDTKSIEQIALDAYVSLKRATEVKESIIEIAKDGIISEDEKVKLAEILETLNEISKVATELQILTKKLDSKK